MVRAKKHLGQNFLRDPQTVEAIVMGLKIAPDDTIIEIGPGHGVLTRSVARSAASVLAIEIDRDLVEVLRQDFQNSSQVRIIESDFLRTKLSDLIPKQKRHRTKIVGNLPYYISTPIIQKLIDERDCFSLAVLMLQREVAERLNAVPGTSDRGYISVLAEDAFNVVRLFDVPPEAFIPRPKVWSSVVSFVPKPLVPGDPAGFRQLVGLAFSQKRKTLLNNLKQSVPNVREHLESAGIDPKRRAESLTLDEWKALAAALD